MWMHLYFFDHCWTSQVTVTNPTAQKVRYLLLCASEWKNLALAYTKNAEKASQVVATNTINFAVQYELSLVEPRLTDLERRKDDMNRIPLSPSTVKNSMVVDVERSWWKLVSILLVLQHSPHGFRYEHDRRSPNRLINIIHTFRWMLYINLNNRKYFYPTWNLIEWYRLPLKKYSTFIVLRENILVLYLCISLVQIWFSVNRHFE